MLMLVIGERKEETREEQKKNQRFICLVIYCIWVKFKLEVMEFQHIVKVGWDMGEEVVCLNIQIGKLAEKINLDGSKLNKKQKINI